jgi:hypothetical protein
MTFFGPISSIFDFATFGIMIWGFGAGATLFRSGWFVESLATQSLVIFAIRTHRVPFFRSRASKPLTISTFVCVGIGVLLPFSPLAGVLGFTALPPTFLAALVVMICLYLVLIELGKRRFYRLQGEGQPIAQPRPPRERRIHHRASRWSIRGRPRGPGEGQPSGAHAEQPAALVASPTAGVKPQRFGLFAPMAGTRAATSLQSWGPYSMLIFAALAFGQNMTAEFESVAELYTYFAATAVIFILILLMPPYRSQRWLSGTAPPRRRVEG